MIAADIVLSSGFLAFARHAGFLKGIERAGVEVTGLCGTSSGALVGALWLAGHGADTVARELARMAPVRYLRPSSTPWRGPFAMSAVIAHLRGLLPARFEGLTVPFGAGVVDASGRPELLTAGALPEAVAASCCLPWAFSPVRICGRRYRDGGIADRLFLDHWRAHRAPSRLVVHEVAASAGAARSALPSDVLRVGTPPSGASFFSLGDFWGQLAEAEALTAAALSTVVGR